jgi:EmrB/QacA subfamily drug resistance transporter
MVDRRLTQRWVLAATILGSSMAFIDGSVVNLALPALQAEMDATIADAQWVVEAYALFLSALLLVGGSLGDRLGRRRIFTLGTAIFGGASLVCGLAPDIATLIGARGVQGVGGALLVPGSLALISANFSDRERGPAIGLWSGFSAMSAGLGPILGGLLVDYFSWRWAFFVNIPLALGVVAISAWRVPESRDPDTTGHLDWLGATLATAGLGGVVYALIEWQAPRAGYGVLGGTFAGGVAALVAFAIRERRCPNPMMPLDVFASRTFSGANVLTLFLYAALSGVLFFLPFNLIQVQGYTTTEAGAALAPFIVLMFLLSRWAGGLVDRVGGRLPLIVGPLVVAAGYTAMAQEVKRATK